jgi:hypothetical protein
MKHETQVDLPDLCVRPIATLRGPLRLEAHSSDDLDREG